MSSKSVTDWMYLVDRVFPVVLFTVSFVILVLAPIGVLSLPGMMSAALSVILCMRKQYRWAGTLGILTAAGSFIAQSVTVICANCTTAAMLFGLAGVVCLFFELKTWPLPILALASLLTASLVLYGASGYTDPRIFVQPVHQGIFTNGMANPIGPEFALLYFSPDCTSCEEELPLFVSADPTGRTWQPIVVPGGLLAKGDALLHEAGYQGQIFAEETAPGMRVPALVFRNVVYTGSDAIEASSYFKQNIKSTGGN